MQIDGSVSMPVVTVGGSAPASRMRTLQLHQDRGKSLREVVVDVAGEPIPFVERRFAPLLETIQLDEPAVMGDAACRAIASSSTTRHQWSSLSRASDATTVIQPSVRVPSMSGAERDVPALHLAEVADFSWQPSNPRGDTRWSASSREHARRDRRP